MKKIKSKAVRDYVMNDMVWKVDFPSFLKEIAECSKSIPYAKTFKILAHVLNVLTERAIEINDPALNIIMLRLGLYEGAHDKNVDEVISQLRKLITDNQKQETKAKVGSWITLAEWKWSDEKKRDVPVCVKTEYVDGENIKADTWYQLKNGKFVEVNE